MDAAAGLPHTATLFVVATPLGNLGDLSSRAAEVLRAVEVVAAEDTRRTRQLLAHLDAHPRLVSYHAHSEPGRLEALLAALRAGEDVALVSDAGTPGVSDPGAALVRAVREAGGRVVPIPGPSALVTALSASGFPADRFLFLGFLPRKGPQRARLIADTAASAHTVVLYEAPHRLVALLEDLGGAAGGTRTVAVARELTKLYEEIRVGPITDQLAHWSGTEPRGECTVVVEGREPPADTADADSARALATRLLADGFSRRETARHVAEETGLSRNDAYRLVMEMP